MYKTLLRLFFCILSTASIPLSAQTGTAVPELTAVDTELKQFMQTWQIHGASVAIVKEDRLVYARGLGYAEAYTATTPQHLFRIASISKPITAMAIMKLVQGSIIGIDDLVFGETGILRTAAFQRINDLRIRKITIRHLLQHTAGWDRTTNPHGDPMFDDQHISRVMSITGPLDATTIIQYLLTQPLDFEPGTRYAYSNVGYNVLGRVIEQVTGLCYEQYVQQNILHPLGIYNMHIGRSLYADKQPNEVRYYAEDHQQLPSVYEPGKKVAAPYGGFNLDAMDAHGGWVASASDLAKLLVAVSNFSRTSSLLTADALQTMATPSNQNPNYAMGWCVNTAGNWWHTGSLIGSSAIMVRLHNGISWVILCNDNPMSKAYFQELDQVMWKALAKVQQWPDHNLFMEPDPMAIQAAEMATPTDAHSEDMGYLFPNPSNWNQVTLRLNEPHQQTPMTVQFFDEAGKQVMQHTVDQPTQDNVVPLNPAIFKKGIYVVRVSNPVSQMTTRMVRSSSEE